MNIKKELAGLLNDLKKLGTHQISDDLKKLIDEIAVLEERHSKANKSKCPVCQGEGFTDNEPFCNACDGTGELITKQKAANTKLISKQGYIKHEGDKWVLYSKKGKALGRYTSRKKALERLRQVEFFKKKNNV